MATRRRFQYEEPPVTGSLLQQVGELAQPLRETTDLSPLMHRIGEVRHVLLGEASHGTSEYYRWRTRLSQRLILEKGFRFIAVEGDWPDCYRLNRYVKGFADSGHSARDVLEGFFRRWPTWMWANEEVVDLIEWLKHHNAGLPEERKIGFYGLDVYSLWQSLAVLNSDLKRYDPKSIDLLNNVFRCFEPYGANAQKYARATVFKSATCENEVVRLLEELQARGAERFAEDGHEAFFQIEQNALVLKNAEAYYRTMVHGGPQSWNIRDRHMADTFDRLMAYHGPSAKGIAWEHNTHIGDARYTDMIHDGMLNVGQLMREHHGDHDVVLVGFGSHHGSVIAGRAWDAPMDIMAVPPGRENSWEAVLHRSVRADGLFIFDEPTHSDEMLEPRGHRAIGVVYHPELEQYGNYVPTVIPRRYDALLYLDETSGLHPLPLAPRLDGDLDDTYPSAV